MTYLGSGQTGVDNGHEKISNYEWWRKMELEWGLPERKPDIRRTVREEKIASLYRG